MFTSKIVKEMKTTIFLSGLGIITPDANGKDLKFFEFHPDEQGFEATKPCQVNGKLQLMRDHTIYFTASKGRVRSNSLLIRKAPHGRLSGTRDNA
jgi:hypothetical protein